MAHTVSTVPGFRLPWTQGAHAYIEADTFNAAREGLKRRRKSVIFHMTNDGEAGGKMCVTCGTLLRDLPGDSKPFEHSGSAPKPDKWSTWHYDPASKTIVGGQHYGCSWGTLLTRISMIRAY